MKRMTALLLCLLMAGTALAEQEIPELLEPVGVAMDTAQAYIGDLRETVLYDAYIAPEVHELSFTIDGRIGEVNVIVGQQVKAGDVLVTLDHEQALESIADMEAEIALMEATAACDEAIAAIDIELLELELARLSIQTPSDGKAIALKELEIEELLLAQERAKKTRQMNLERKREACEKVKADVQQGVIVAPCDGTVIHVADIEPGSYAVAYSALIYLADDSQLSIASEFISSVELAGAVEIYALVGGNRYEVVQRKINPDEYAAKLLSGEQMDITFDFIGQMDEVVQPGRYVALCLVRHAVEDTLLIPSNAVFRDEGGAYVYLIEDGERKRSEIKCGLITEWTTEVVGGLKEGDVVYVQE